MPSQKTSNGTGQVSHRLRNFFRMNTGGSTGSASSDKDKEKEKEKGSAATTPDPSKSRHTKFFSNTVGRLRAHTVASEGNQLEEAMSPTAHANPYFAHQGQPGLRHHNSDSVPPSPPIHRVSRSKALMVPLRTIKLPAKPKRNSPGDLEESPVHPMPRACSPKTIPTMSVPRLPSSARILFSQVQAHWAL
ncbi:serine/threonine protein kinase, AGC [Fusarium oxysporum]|nr:serine/threonine protein kinase, AGC [Fusarium oxysporum]